MRENFSNEMVFRHPDFVVNDASPVLPQRQTVDWGTLLLDIPRIHALGITGKGQVVSVIDTGIDEDHPDLKGAIQDIVNTTNEKFAATHGHGIGAAGVIAAQNNNVGVLGAAPGSKILGIKGMRESGGGSVGEIVNAVYHAADSGSRVINMSLGTGGNVPAFEKAIQYAHSKGCHIVCSAGNVGRDNSVLYPARYPQTYSVGAINQAGKVSAFSSRGPQILVAAPGERVLVPWKNKSWARVSGTSFSAPYVAACIALFLEAEAIVSQKRIELTAIDIEEPGYDYKSGYGLINPFEFIERYAGKDEKQPTPAATQPPAPAPNPSPAPAPTRAPAPTMPPAKDVDFENAQRAYELLGKFLSDNLK